LLPEKNVMSWGQSLVEPPLHLASVQTPLEHVPVPRMSVSRLLAFLFPRLLGTGTGRLGHRRVHKKFQLLENKPTIFLTETLFLENGV